MKITSISDTHGQEPVLPGGDLLIHSGDLSINGFKIEIIKQLNYLHEQFDKYQYIVLTPGNHDLWAERHLDQFKEACLSAGIICLINEGVEIEGKKIWGSPATLFYHNWAFNYNSKDIINIWDRIPVNLDILVTHSPPHGILDKTKDNEIIGCPDLLERIKIVKPKIHTFGHVHESKGQIQLNDTLFMNNATIVTNFIL